jgi:hypothetical protein
MSVSHPTIVLANRNLFAEPAFQRDFARARAAHAEPAPPSPRRPRAPKYSGRKTFDTRTLHTRSTHLIECHIASSV